MAFFATDEAAYTTVDNEDGYAHDKPVRTT